MAGSLGVQSQIVLLRPFAVANDTDNDRDVCDELRESSTTPRNTRLTVLFAAHEIYTFFDRADHERGGRGHLF